MGPVLGKAAFSENFTINLDKPTKTNRLSVRIVEFPKDSEGRNRAWIGSVVVK